MTKLRKTLIKVLQGPKDVVYFGYCGKCYGTKGTLTKDQIGKMIDKIEKSLKIKIKK